MVSVNHDVHSECECCQAAECDDAGELREHNGLGLAELAKALELWADSVRRKLESRRAARRA